MFQQKHKKMNILDAMHLWHRNPLRLQQSRTALPLISVNVDRDDKICEWVEMQGHSHCPSPIYEFIYVEKSVHTNIGDQPTSVDRPSPSSVHMTGQEEKCCHFPTDPLTKMF